MAEMPERIEPSGSRDDAPSSAADLACRSSSKSIAVRVPEAVGRLGSNRLRTSDNALSGLLAAYDLLLHKLTLRPARRHKGPTP